MKHVKKFTINEGQGPDEIETDLNAIAQDVWLYIMDTYHLNERQVQIVIDKLSENYRLM